MVTLYADPSVPSELIELLQDRGVSLVTAANQRIPTASPRHQLITAMRHAWVFTSGNVSVFEPAHDLIVPGPASEQQTLERRHSGIILLNFEHDPQTLAEALSDLFSQVDPATLWNRLYRWRSLRWWLRSNGAYTPA